MTRWAPARSDTIAALADEILHNYAKGRVMVAIDGVDGAGKTVFANDLAAAIEATGHAVARATIDDFHAPSAVRYARGTDSPEGFYLDSFDYDSFRSALVVPFKSGGDFSTGVFDHLADAAAPRHPQSAPADTIMIVDGIFLNRPELRGIWNYSVWLDVPTEIAEERVRGRAVDNATGPRYTGGQELYIAEAGPRLRAVAIIDNTDYDHPRRVFADSC